MQNTELKTIVEENKIKTISLFQGDGVSRYEFDIDSPDYMEQKHYGVEGPYRVNLDMLYIDGTLEERKEELIPVKIGVDDDESSVVDNKVDNSEQKIEEMINTPVRAIVFHRNSLLSANTETTTQHVTLFAEGVIDQYKKSFNVEVSKKDFAVIEIDFENRSVSLKSIAE